MLTLSFFLAIWIDKAYLLLVVLPALITSMLSRNQKLDNFGIVMLVFVICLLVWAGYFVLFPPIVDLGNIWWPEIGSLDYSWSLLGFAFLLSMIILRPSKEKLIGAISMATNLHALICVAQFFLQRFHFNIDIYQIFGGEMPQRTTDDPLGLRAAGLFLEPSTYAAMISPAIIFLGLVKARFYLIILPMTSLLFTLSTVAYLQFIIISIILILKYNSSHTAKFILAMILCVLVFAFGAVQFERVVELGVEAGSIAYRISAISWLGESELSRQLMGSGFGINDCDCLVQDAGLIFSTFFYFGVIGLIPLLVILRGSGWLSFLVAGISKAAIFHPSIIIFFGLLFVWRKYYNKSFADTPRVLPKLIGSNHTIVKPSQQG